MRVDYDSLLAIKRKSLRSRSWFKLSVEDRGLFRCAMWVAGVQGHILSMKLLVRVLGIVLKLAESVSSRIWIAGRERAEELKQSFEDRGLFCWAPQARRWLADKSFIFYLGVNEE